MTVVLSLFDGIGVAAQALKNLGIDCEYYAIEIDKYARKVADARHPTLKRPTNDVLQALCSKLPSNPDLLIFGSPCTALSKARTAAKKGRGLVEQSALFYEAIKIRDRLNPKHVLMENVCHLRDEDQKEIDRLMAFSPQVVCSSHFTAQTRLRQYWTDLKFPDDKEYSKKTSNGVKFADILESGPKGHNLSSAAIEFMNKEFCDVPRWKKNGHWRHDAKTRTVTANYCKKLPYAALRRGARTDKYKPAQSGRYLTVIEVERLQGLPDNYTSGISNYQRYKAVGNSFTLPVIECFLKGLQQ